MSTVSVASKVHKWLALLLAIPILFWFASGLFFAIAPIETVRSEHVKAEITEPPVSLARAGDGLRRLAASGLADAARVEIKTMFGRPVALVSREGGRPRLYDLVSGSAVSPVSAATAAAIAERDLAGNARARRVERVTKESTEYRGLLPAWRVDFDEGKEGATRSLYVSMDTGAVTARRSTLWRWFDFFWSLHILDFEDHEDFNTPLLIGAAFLAMIVLVSGIIMFPSRLGFTGWRRRRRNRQLGNGGG